VLPLATCLFLCPAEPSALSRLSIPDLDSLAFYLFSSCVLQLFSSSALQLFSSSALQLFSSSALQLFSSSALQLRFPSFALFRRMFRIFLTFCCLALSAAQSIDHLDKKSSRALYRTIAPQIQLSSSAGSISDTSGCWFSCAYWFTCAHFVSAISLG